MNNNVIKVVWVDDYIEAFSDYCDELRDNGIEVVTAKKISDIDGAVLSSVDVMIVDNKFGEDGLNDGYEFVHNVTGARGNPLRLVFFSAYLEDADVESVLNKNPINNTITLFYPKGFHRSSKRPAEISRFTDKIMRFANSSIAEMEVDHFRTITVKKDRTTVDYQHYKNLGPDEKSKILAELAPQHKKSASEWTALGATWVLFYSGDDQAHSSSLSGGSTPDWEKINNFAVAQNKIPILFEINLPIDDIKCASDSAIGMLETYPRAGLYLNPSKGDTRTDIHFDTGSDNSYLNSRLVSEIGLAEEADEDAKIITVSGQDMICTKISWPIGLGTDPRKTGKVRGNLVAYSVHNWDHGPLKISCSDTCTRNTDKTTTSCVFRRNGLLGRNLLRDMQTDATVKYDDPMVHFTRRNSRKRG